MLFQLFEIWFWVTAPVAAVVLWVIGRARSALDRKDLTGVRLKETPEPPLAIGGRAVERWQIQRSIAAGSDQPSGLVLEKSIELRLCPPSGHRGYGRGPAVAPLRALVERLGAGFSAWHDDLIAARVPADASLAVQRATAVKLVAFERALGGPPQALWDWLAEPDGACATARARLLMDEAAGTPQAQAVAARLANHPDPSLGARAALVRDDPEALAARATQPLQPGLQARVLRALALHDPGGLARALREVPLHAREVRDAAVAGLDRVEQEAALGLLDRLWRAAPEAERGRLLAAYVQRSAGTAQAWDALAAGDAGLRQAGADALWSLLGSGAEAAAIERLVPGAGVTLGLCEALSRRGSAAAVPALLTVQRFEGPAAEAAGWAIADIQDRARGRQGGLALAGEGGGLALAGEAGGLTEVTE